MTPSTATQILRMCVVATTSVLFCVACAGPKKTHKAGDKLPPPPEGNAAAASTEADAHFGEVKAAAAEQLECPADQVTVQCTGRDAEGTCIAVRAFGCDKTLELEFGER